MWKRLSMSAHVCSCLCMCGTASLHRVAHSTGFGRCKSGQGRQNAKCAQAWTRTRKSKVEQLRASVPVIHIPFQTPASYGFGRYGFGFFGPSIAFRATGALWGRATPFFYHFSVYLSSILGQTELCHEVWTPGPPKTPNHQH